MKGDMGKERGNDKGERRMGPQGLVHTYMYEILKNTLIAELILLTGARRQHKRLPREANSLAPPLPNFSVICLEADRNLFCKVLHNPEHVLH